MEQEQTEAIEDGQAFDIDQYPEEVECDNKYAYKNSGFVALAIGGFGLFNTRWSSIFSDFPDNIGIMYFLNLLPLAAFLIFAAITAYRYQRFQKFGITKLKVSDKVGVVGGVLRGSFRSSKEITPSSDYVFTLTCNWSRQYQDKGKQKTETKTVWTGKQELRSKGYSSRSGIPFEIAIPGDCIPSSNNPYGESFEWRLEVLAPTKGINYKGEFYVWIIKR